MIFGMGDFSTRTKLHSTVMLDFECRIHKENIKQTLISEKISTFFLDNILLAFAVLSKHILKLEVLHSLLNIL